MRFEVIGKVKGKGRPRFSTRGKYVTTYTPESTVTYENWIKTCFLNQCKGYKPFLGAVKLTVYAYFKIPKSYTKKRKQFLLETKKNYTHKSDIDNIIKCVGDALNGVAFKDDAQITEINAIKEYGEEDKLVVEIEEILKSEYL